MSNQEMVKHLTKPPFSFLLRTIGKVKVKKQNQVGMMSRKITRQKAVAVNSPEANVKYTYYSNK